MLSNNNSLDANECIEIVSDYDKPAIVAVKHMNPCGIGVATTISQAFQKAYDADPISIFGGIIASNREIDAETAEKLSEIFLEIVIAPQFTEEALTVLTKKKNMRLLELPRVDRTDAYQKLTTGTGGVLVQQNDRGEIAEDALTYPTTRKPTNKEMAHLLSAWKAV